MDTLPRHRCEAVEFTDLSTPCVRMFLTCMDPEATSISAISIIKDEGHHISKTKFTLTANFGMASDLSGVVTVYFCGVHFNSVVTLYFEKSVVPVSSKLPNTFSGGPPINVVMLEQPGGI